VLNRRFSSFLIALAGGLTAGIGYPFVDLILACRIPASEACVWGKAYFPLTLALSVVLIGGTATGLLYVVLRWLRRSPSDEAANR
jgi:hypothetical protein